MDVISTQDRGTITENKPPKVIRTKRKDRSAVGGKLEIATSSIALAFPTEPKKSETKKLKKKLQEVALQNESLAKAINDKNNEILDLKRSVKSLNEVLNSVPIEELRCNSSIASTKILDLSKKNRVLRAELETTKNCVTKKDVRIQRLERDLKATEQKLKQDPNTRKTSPTAVDDLQTKLNSVQQKLFETKNKNAELHSQLKLAQKCLQQEVGENFNLNTLASSGGQSTWRGRSQQILHLQQRVHELKERLVMYEQNNGEYSIHNYNDTKINVPSVVSSTQSTPTTPSNRFHTNIDRFTPNVRKSEILHRAKVETLENDITELKLQLDEQRGKVLALKVRNKTLNDEMLKYKMKTCTLEEQTDYNGINLASMNEKLSAQKYQYENHIEKLSRDVAKEVRNREETEFRLEELRSDLENLQELLSSKDKHIVKLSEHIERVEADMKAICGEFLFSCRELRKEEFIAILDSLEAEKNMLIEHNKNQNERIEQERKKSETMSEQLSKQKIRIHRMEATIRHLEKELDVQTERRKRSQRIAEYANNVSTTSLSSFVFENSSIASMMGSTNTSTSDDIIQPQIEDLKNQLEFANEKITMLQEKITHISEEKELDARTFEEIIINSKNIILDTILGQRSNILDDMSRGSGDRN